MKILLINPPTNESAYSSVPKEFYKLRGQHPPLGLLYIASYLLQKKPDYKIEVCDLDSEKNPFDLLKNRMKNFNPDIVGIQILSMLAPNAIEILKIVKKESKETITVAGGVHSTLFPKETVSSEYVDYVVTGEGEVTFYELVDYIENGNRNISKIDGLVYKKSSKIILNKERIEIKNIDDFPLIDRRMLNLERYKSFFSHNKMSTSIITSRGCPYSCIFCFNPHKNFRAHSSEYVLKDIKNCLDAGIKEIFVVDDTFSIDLNRAKKICHLIIKEKLNFRWYINTRINTVDRELLYLLKIAGCQQINYGIESASQRTVDFLQKKIDMKEAKEIIKMTKKAGIETLCYFMLGLPRETKEEIELTMKFIREIKPDFVRFSVTTLDPGTKLFNLAVKENMVDKNIWKDFAYNPVSSFEAPVWSENFTKEELEKLLITLSKKYYFSLGYIIKNIFKTKNWLNLKENIEIFFQLLKM
jgi:anaerobic magnesium-protoporphyrin IX monomethyl ester cyclase